jgi:pimeloyl-ACP methyl ester carboxylesterase
MPISSQPLSSQQMVYTVKEYGDPHSNKVVFFFCPLAISSQQLSRPGMPIWRLARRGYRVITYDYPSAISTTSVAHTLANMEAILTDANDRLAQISASAEVSSFGSSMGTVLAVNLAVQHPRIKKVILNLSYADISEHILHLPNLPTVPTKKLQKYLEEAGGEEALRAAFDPYSPLKLVHTLAHKKVLLYASKNDHILKPMHTVAFRKALIDAGVDLEYHETNGLRHVPALMLNYMQYKRWMRFLES